MVGQSQVMLYVILAVLSRLVAGHTQPVADERTARRRQGKGHTYNTSEPQTSL